MDPALYSVSTWNILNVSCFLLFFVAFLSNAEKIEHIPLQTISYPLVSPFSLPTQITPF